MMSILVLASTSVLLVLIIFKFAVLGITAYNGNGYVGKHR
ncbi:hypothetical protein GCM10010182_40850 [Actinomadura cremea]|nr:hypothetical protein GCM10010182_40850 [Actinomadura cremea]